ncbi:histidinol dehydrogenase [Roseibium algicola]|uniref:Histidinol dehydrogenase n=1 Tax=Roseibium algicola TaxID=2857014 RepID=A0ABN4X5B5_9HYPH|nr:MULTISPECIES: histidinol dehydrogenase [Stappiaceae]AQQ07126.1 histidinol dehydrogenase [Roseibium aggregatum]MEE2864034.1 histidinol dehydrogenase [Pseudomonadota bacterium]NKI58324.1 histidinol dehydrogenase [Labrenzia sp. PO1]UES59142.1 histidinol dehydrogenase [Roseibium aggregatum]
MENCVVLRLNINDARFEDQFKALLSGKREVSEDVDQIVRDILERVRTEGDKAVLDYTARFDRLQAESMAELTVSAAEIDAALAKVPQETLDALQLAHDRIHAHHARQMPKDDRYTDPIGVELGSLWTAVEAVGIYVPGGTASYPSSVLMNAVPAKVAGVERIVMVVPSPDGVLNPLVLAAARIAGVTEIYRIGGAQAVAALAYGTQTIAPVAKIVGPGNAFVAAAKRRVFGTVGIDMIAGPSEVLILADSGNNADWLAADLLAQAEHDTAAQSILITDSEDLANQVEAAVEAQLKTLPREDVARASWQDYGAIILVDDLEAAMPLANRIAPEHLELAVADPEALLKKVRNAGAVFLGHYTPEAIGDYVGGSNHVLPTARSARFSSGLSVLEFVKRTSILKCNADNLRQLGPAAIALGESEGLSAHARSVSIRLNL